MSAEFCEEGVAEKICTKISISNKLENASHYLKSLECRITWKLLRCLLPMAIQGADVWPMPDKCEGKDLVSAGLCLGINCTLLSSQSKECVIPSDLFKRFLFSEESCQRVRCPQKKEKESIFRCQSRKSFGTVQMKAGHDLHRESWNWSLTQGVWSQTTKAQRHFKLILVLRKLWLLLSIPLYAQTSSGKAKKLLLKGKYQTEESRKTPNLLHKLGSHWQQTQQEVREKI